MLTALQVMDRFINSNDDENFFFVFVDSLSEYYNEVSESPVEQPSSTSSPFKGKTTHECYLLLQQLCESTESDIDYECFAIMDTRSIGDGTLLLAEGADESGKAESVRVPFDHASRVLLNYRAGSASVSEHCEQAAKEADGVLRLW